MSWKVFLWLIFLGTIVSWVSLAMVIIYFDPEEISFLGFMMFYISLFLSLSGTIFLISDWLKSKIFKKQLYPRIRSSIRHAIFFTLLILGWAFLKSFGLLRWWNILIYILILTVLEFFFISSQKPGKNLYQQQQ